MNTTKPTFEESKEIVENNLETVKTIAALICFACLVLIAGLKWVAKHAVLAAKESYKSGVNARLAMFPPSHFSSKDYHEALMKSRPQWLVRAESLRKSVVKRTETWRGFAKRRVNDSISTLLAEGLGIPE